MANKYPFNIAWSAEDQEYVATCPAFPGLSALGETEEEALVEAKVALGAVLEACKREGIEIPDAELADSFSGQFRVRLPKSLHRQASQLAAVDGISLNQLVISAVEQRVGTRQQGARMLAEMKQLLREHQNQFIVTVDSALSRSDERVLLGEVQIETETQTSRTQTQRVVTKRLNRGN
jgi:predicted RNase H-like HicB family nuclease